MAWMLIVSGWILDLLSILWIMLILLDILFSWITTAGKPPGPVQYGLTKTAALPVDLLRRTMPTVYREMDFAPWLTILLLILMRTFIFRAMIYWGMLHRPAG
ncbi:YggT family protein [bacterium]|nr:YggT family protein [bacterium]